MPKLRRIIAPAVCAFFIMAACGENSESPALLLDAGPLPDAAGSDAPRSEREPDAGADSGLDGALEADSTNGDGEALVVPPPLPRLIGGGNTSCLLGTGGRLRCWGVAGYSSGGTNDPDKESIGDQAGEMPPRDSAFLPVGDVAVQASLARDGAFGCVVTDKKRVRCFGVAPFSGMLGTTDDVIGDEATDFPAPALDLGDDILQVATGDFHACALTTAGKVRCWGGNDAGQLGNGSTAPILSFPPPEVPLLGVMVRVYAGGDGSCAIGASGKVYCWGANYSGRFGRGISSEELVGDVPGEMPPPPSDFGGPVKGLALGANHICALRVTGEVRCAGDNRSSPLGIVTSLSSVGDKAAHLPLTAANVGTDVVHVAATSDTTCVLSASGEVRCFGSNQSGACAAGADLVAGDRSAEFPRPAIDLGEPALALTGGGGHFCALLATDRVRCWGNGGNGQLGHGANTNIGDDDTPASIPAVPIFP